MTLSPISDNDTYIELVNQPTSIRMDPTCAICLEDLTPEEAVGHFARKATKTTQAIFHGFHESCAAPWQQSNETCVTCKKPLDALVKINGTVVAGIPKDGKFLKRLGYSFAIFMMAFLLWYLGDDPDNKDNPEKKTIFNTSAAIVLGGGVLMMLYACFKCCCPCCPQRSANQDAIAV